MRAGFVGVTTAMLAAGAAFGQQPAKQAEVQEVTVRTDDGWSLPVTYYSNPSKESPAVILLHGADGNRNVWKGLAGTLQKSGYAVVAVDLRKHGDSQGPATGAARSERLTPNDYRGMVNGDLEAVKSFLIEKHNAGELNIRKTAVVAADNTAPVAVNWALADWLKEPYPDAPTFEARTPRGQDVRALVLLSPSEGAGGMNLGRALPQLKNQRVAALIAVGDEDRVDKGTAEKSYERLTSGAEEAKERAELIRYPKLKQRGTELLTIRGLPLERQIVAFLDKHLKQLPDPWQNRKSRL